MSNIPACVEVRGFYQATVRIYRIFLIQPVILFLNEDGEKLNYVNLSKFINLINLQFILIILNILYIHSNVPRFEFTLPTCGVISGGMYVTNFNRS